MDRIPEGGERGQEDKGQPDGNMRTGTGGREQDNEIKWTSTGEKGQVEGERVTGEQVDEING